MPKNPVRKIFDRDLSVREAWKDISTLERAMFEMYDQALVISHETGIRPDEGIILKNIGHVYYWQRRYAEALEAYGQAMDVFETIRAMAGSETGRASFIAQHAKLYTRAVYLFHRQGQDKDAFFTSERGRARAFLDTL